MLAELLRVVAEKRAELLSRIRSVGIPASEVRRLWVSYEPSASPASVCGVDGSMNLREFKSFAIFAISAEAVTFSPAGIREARLCDVDVVYPHYRPVERVRLYMLTMEALAALRACDGADVVLLDGSLISNVVRHTPRGLASALALAGGELRGVVEAEEFNARELAERAVRRGCSEDDVVCLEYARYLTLLGRLVKRCAGRLVAVAKTSQSTIYFGGPKPDMAVFEKLTRGPGFSRPMHRRLSDSLGRLRGPDRSAVLSAVGDFDLTIFHFRLAEGGPVLKAEAVGRWSEGEVMAFLDSLARYSVMGYPYPLRRAHADSDVRERDMECVLRVLGLYAEETGREQHAALAAAPRGVGGWAG